LTTIDFSYCSIGTQGASALAEALTVNTSVTDINLDRNTIGDDGASALVDVLNINTSVTSLCIQNSEDDEDVSMEWDHFQHEGPSPAGADESLCAAVQRLVTRNSRFRRLCLYDAREMLKLRLCSDEYGVVWSYFITSSAGTDDGAAPDNVESLRVEMAAVVDERRHYALHRPALVSHVCSLQLHTENQSAELANQMTIRFAEQTSQIAAQTSQIAEQSSQIADLQRLIVKQNQAMQDQIRQMHASLMTRSDEESRGVDERSDRAAKRRRTGR
jgi:hypothetical protein